jgi:glycosyltransferase involved in cell wall biosynthesis
MRAAFLTPEHISESSDGGGLGVYVHRIARSFLDAGHEAEVFFASKRASETSTFDAVPIHYVNVADNYPSFAYLSKASRQAVWLNNLRGVVEWVLRAKALAAAVERRHAVAPFELVQSTDYMATGLVLDHRNGRVHAVRCSTATDLYSQADGTTGIRQFWRAYLERKAMRRADLRYAPSGYIAEHFQRVHKIDVRVVRPPAYPEAGSVASPPLQLPRRFFLHFGALRERKGTLLLAQALPFAWEKAPGLTMVWSGRADEREFKTWRSLWGRRSNQVHITRPLDRQELYALLKRADAAVLPSQVDNLPNTVIESLMFGIPVVGSRGASIDELIEEGRTGHLVALGDVKGLGEALAMMWLGNSPVAKGFTWDSQVAHEMRPKQAVANLIELARSVTLNLSEHRAATRLT